MISRSGRSYGPTKNVASVGLLRGLFITGPNSTAKIDMCRVGSAASKLIASPRTASETRRCSVSAENGPTLTDSTRCKGRSWVGVGGRACRFGDGSEGMTLVTSRPVGRGTSRISHSCRSSATTEALAFGRPMRMGVT